MGILQSSPEEEDEELLYYVNWSQISLPKIQTLTHKVEMTAMEVRKDPEDTKIREPLDGHLDIQVTLANLATLDTQVKGAILAKEDTQEVTRMMMVVIQATLQENAEQCVESKKKVQVSCHGREGH